MFNIETDRRVESLPEVGLGRMLEWLQCATELELINARMKGKPWLPSHASTVKNLFSEKHPYVFVFDPLP